MASMQTSFCYLCLVLPILANEALSQNTIECEPLLGIENGVITYAPDVTANYDLNAVATYTCNEGYFLDISADDASATRVCVDDGDNDALGIFNRQAPICVPIECLPLPDLVNGMITYNPDVDPNYELGTTAMYSCNESYFLEVTESTTVVRTCQDDDGMNAFGRFSGQAPRCVHPTVPRDVRGLCSIVRWRTPYIMEDIPIEYEVRYVIPGAEDVIRIVPEVQTDSPRMFGSERPRVRFQVRTRSAVAVGRWSPLVSLGC